MDDIPIMALLRQPDRQWHPYYGARDAPVPDLRLLHATWQDRMHGRVAAVERDPHAHDVYHVVVYVSGSGTFVAPEGPVAFVAPYLVLTAPGQPHCFTGGPGEDAVYSELTFAGSDADGMLRLSWNDLLSRHFCGPCHVHVHGAAPEACLRAIDRSIADLTALGHAQHPQAEGHARLAITQVLGLIWQHLVATPAEPQDAVTQARAILDERLDDPPSADDLARLVGLPPKRLARLFSARYGEPPGRYRQRATMERAADLLRGTGLSLADVAERLGFRDPRYFIRVFRQIHGVTPARFRRSGAGCPRPAG